MIASLRYLIVLHLGNYLFHKFADLNAWFS